MSKWQCSHCFQIYSFDDWMKLKTEWVDQKQKHKYGKRAICKCGKPFHKDKWNMTTDCDGYRVSTVHLELAHPSNILTDGSEEEKNMWYETMIFDERKKKKGRTK